MKQKLSENSATVSDESIKLESEVLKFAESRYQCNSREQYAQRGKSKPIIIENNF